MCLLSGTAARLPPMSTKMMNNHIKGVLITELIRTIIRLLYSTDPANLKGINGPGREIQRNGDLQDCSNEIGN